MTGSDVDIEDDEQAPAGSEATSVSPRAVPPRSGARGQFARGSGRPPRRGSALRRAALPGLLIALPAVAAPDLEARPAAMLLAPVTVASEAVSDVGAHTSPSLVVTTGDPGHSVVAATFQGAPANASIHGGAWRDLRVGGTNAETEAQPNVSETGNWLKLSIQQGAPDAIAAGARVEVEAGGETQVQDIAAEEGQAGSQADPLHFDLGDAETARVRVIWPDGTVGSWRDVPVNARIGIMRVE